MLLQFDLGENNFCYLFYVKYYKMPPCSHPSAMASACAVVTLSNHLSIHYSAYNSVYRYMPLFHIVASTCGS